MEVKPETISPETTGEKIYTVQGQSFKLLAFNLSMLNKAVPLIHRLRKLYNEYTGSIDMSAVEAYQARLKEIEIAKSQLDELISSGKDENETELTEEKKSEINRRIVELEQKIKNIKTDYENDDNVQNLLNDKLQGESLAMFELITDVAFIKPVLSKILTGGDLNKIDLNDITLLNFLREVITDFFLLILSSKIQF